MNVICSPNYSNKVQKIKIKYEQNTQDRENTRAVTDFFKKIA